MMYKRLVAVPLILLFTMVSPAAAIINGQPDGSNHPYVGLVVFYDATGAPAWRCSGTLVSPRVFLTAAHCTYGATSAQVWFDPIPPATYPYSGGVRGSRLYVMPGYRSEPLPGLPGFDYHDVGVVILDKKLKLNQFGSLPLDGLVDTLAMKTEVTVVGYGVQYKLQISGDPYYRWRGRTRMFALAELIQSDDVISGEFVKLTQDPGQDKGGTCFGDSGGPVLYDGSIILAVTSFGSNVNCAGVGYYNRVDTTAALEFITPFLSA